MFNAFRIHSIVPPWDCFLERWVFLESCSFVVSFCLCKGAWWSVGHDFSKSRLIHINKTIFFVKNKEIFRACFHQTSLLSMNDIKNAIKKHYYWKSMIL